MTAAVSRSMAARAAAGIVARREAHIEGPCAESRTTSRARPRSPRPRRRFGRASPARAPRLWCGPVILNASLSAFSFASAPQLMPEHGVETRAREFREPRRGALANRHGQRIGLKGHLPRLALERSQPARDGHSPSPRPHGRRKNPKSCGRRARTATRPRHAPPRWDIARTPAPNGFERARHRSAAHHGVSLGPSGCRGGEARAFVEPQQRFIHCMPPPAAPLFKLSSTDITAMEVPLVTAHKCA